MSVLVLVSAENVARQWTVTRQEQDEFALQSQQRCEAAQNAGHFDQEIVPVIIQSRTGNGAKPLEMASWTGEDVWGQNLTFLVSDSAQLCLHSPAVLSKVTSWCLHFAYITKIITVWLILCVCVCVCVCVCALIPSFSSLDECKTCFFEVHEMLEGPWA